MSATQMLGIVIVDHLLLSGKNSNKMLNVPPISIFYPRLLKK
jgi:hypothetical protein